MADSTSQWQGRAAKVPPPPNANSPLSPASPSSNPISFRTNVNRAKTKRWVEAKHYSYDGGDWGDEEEDDEPPVAAHPPFANHRTGSSSELSSRRLSGLAQASEGSRASPSAEAQQSSNGGDQATLPFIRPADIYKRMREGRSSVDSGRSAESPPSAVQPGGSSMPPVTRSGNVSKPESANAPPMGLPEVKRVSAFGTDFFSGGDSTSRQPAAAESHESSLHHNPSEASSQGFRSVVHQAFDVPQTPSTAAGSVERSNSDGTSTLSPIMSSQAWVDGKTPTIPEEPESSTPTGATEGAFFKPGHRRDLSLPSSDDGPSKKPVVTDQNIAASEHAEVSSVHPSGYVDQRGSAEQPSDAGSMPVAPAESDFVAPLKFGSNGNNGTDAYRGDVPGMLHSGSTGTLPRDADNDQLREEIIRSLSREGSHEPDQEPQSQGTKDESIPHQFEKYWDNGAIQTGPNFDETPRALVSESHPNWTSSHPLGPQDPYAAGQPPNGGSQLATSEPTAKPRMARRFSWESSSSSEEPASHVPGGMAASPPLSAALATQRPEPLRDDMEVVSEEPPMTDDKVSDGQKVEKPRLSIVPPVAENGSPPEQIAGPMDAPSAQRDVALAKVGTQDIDETHLKSFREILSIAVPAERIRAFDHARDQFAATNTGLRHWLELTAHDHPEHTDLVYPSQTLSADLPRADATSHRFAKLASLGNLTSKDEGTPTGTGHDRRPSGHIVTIVNRQNVEQRGKDLLHTAGTFGGKAGEAAKGLFAKGRSKFRPSGDKGQSTSPRRSSHFQFSFSADRNDSNGNSSFRNSVSFGSLPIFKSGRNESEAAVHSERKGYFFPKNSAIEEPTGKRFKASGSLDLLRYRNNVGDKMTGRRKSEGFTGQSEVATDFEREIDLALGLSPTEPRNGLMQSSDHTAATGDHVVSSTKDLPDKEKDLPSLPASGQSSEMADSTDQPDSEVSKPTALSVRSVTPGERKPSTTPKDHPPDVPPKDLPSKDMPPEDVALKNLPLGARVSLFPRAGHSQRQPSVSTLCADERMASRESETPPSPIQAPATEAKNPVYVKPVQRDTASEALLPSVEEDSAGFTVWHPRRQISAQILEDKRRSISGMPDIRSPLRNEVRYSPGTRSSILSFGSFGRSTRPGTPANELRAAESGSSAANGDSRMDKLKSFGKRRRASVGDLLSGIQGKTQAGSQDLPEGSKRKRTFSRISGLFGRSNEAQLVESRQGEPVKTNEAFDAKALPNLPSIDHTVSSGESPKGYFADKALPAMPEDHNEATDFPQPTFNPNPSVKSRKSIGNQPETSVVRGTAPDEMTATTTSLSKHPHRNEACFVNEPTEPVELAIKDDSSEEIVMSPTTYPGQEWTPMHM